MADTPNVQAPLWAASEASPWLMSGKRARIFDAFCTRSIIETRADTAPPGSCADGARFLVSGLGGAATGLWATHEDHLAIAVGANASNGWYFSTVAVEGVELYVRDENILIRNNGAAWVNIGSGVFRFQDLLDVTTAGLADGELFVWDASNGVLYPQTVSNLTAPILLSYVQASLDTDVTLAANSDTRVASQKATKTYVDNAVTSVLHLRGSTDCSANPNYPAAVKGDAYVVTVAGKIGGASGATVSIGDIYFATADNAGGTQASVGTSWDVLVHASVAAGGGLLAANNLSDLANASTARTNLGLGTAAVKATGTSGNTVPLLDGANTWSGAQTDSLLATFTLGANMTPAAAPATNAVGYLGAPQNIQNGTYTTVMSDVGKHLYHTSGSAHTWTIDSNANVAYPIGTILTFVNESGGGVVTLAITSDTLRWGASTGSRSLAANGTATALKVTATAWRLTGDGIT